VKASTNEVDAYYQPYMAVHRECTASLTQGLEMSGKTKKTLQRDVKRRESIDDLLRAGKVTDSVLMTTGHRSPISHHTGSISGLIEFVQEVIYTDDLPYLIESGPTRKRARAANRVLATGIKNVYAYCEMFSADTAYAPHLRLFFEHFPKHPLSSMSAFDPNGRLQDGRCDAEIANDFVTYLRAQGNKARIKSKIADWKRTTEENRKRLKVYVPALFERYARLMVVRLDVNYRKAMAEPEEILAIAHQYIQRAATDAMYLLNGESIDDIVAKRGTRARVEIDEVKGDLEHFFRNMRSKPSLFEQLVGYVWTIEFARVGGYHAHLALFFDGSKVTKDAWYGDEIGQYIEQIITDGRTVVHNCNRDREKYGENWAIGMVEYFDAEKREKLMRVLDYLAKDSQSVYVKPAKGSQMFGTGQLPDETPKTGPKRSK
jgi:hypothetical protein